MRKDGTGLPVSVISAPIMADGKIVASVTAFQDITELKQAGNKPREMSLNDELTGLYNRRGFLSLIEQYVRIAKRQNNVSLTEGRGETVLLAEDDASAREIMAEVLRLSGYTVIEATDGEDALMLFRDKKEGVDLVLLDVRMPKKDGKEVYEEIMKSTPETAVLFMSGYTKDIIDSHGIVEQGLNFISKAASPEEILTKILEVLDQKKNK